MGARVNGTARAPNASESAAASGEQVEDQDDYGHDQQKVNESAGDMEAETEEPQNQHDYEDCPEHGFSFGDSWTPARAGAPTNIHG